MSGFGKELETIHIAREAEHLSENRTRISEQDAGPAIAIDFGTSRTKLAYLDATTGKPELMRIGHRDDPFIPSLFYLERESERILIGDEAEAMLEQDPAGVVDVLKRKLHESHVRANRRRITPLELLTRLLTELRTRAGREVTAFRGQLAATVHLTVPAIFGPSQERILREAARQAGFSVVEFVYEPVAAARAWLAQSNADKDGVVVLDCGGGTLDWAYLRRDGQDYRLVPECPPGGDRVGGYDLDLVLLARVEDLLDDAAIIYQRGQEIVSLQAVRAAKEHYCRGLPLRPVRVAGYDVQLKISDFEVAFEARFIRHTCEVLKGYLSQVSAVSGSDKPPVLVVGGSARIKGLREGIQRECGCETVWWERADYATALGAVPGMLQNRLESAVAAGGEAALSRLHIGRLVDRPSLVIDDLARDMAEGIKANLQGGDDVLRSYLHERAKVRIDTWLAAAESGHSEAQWLIGMCLNFGVGIGYDEDKALVYLHKAAEKGSAGAQFSLGWMYQQGKGFAQDEVKAVLWYRRAVAQGYVNAQPALDLICLERQRLFLKNVRLLFVDLGLAYSLAAQLVELIREKMPIAHFLNSIDIDINILKSIRSIMDALFEGPDYGLNLQSQKPIVILLVGTQGSGKTLTAAKLANWLQETQSLSVMVVSVDVYRPAAIEQLKTVATEVGAEFYPSTPDQNPIDIAKRALDAARKHFKDVLIVDTAGRLHVDSAMMDEMKAIHAALKPVETLFVVDAMTGQDAANSTKAFDEALPLTGVVLTKTEGDTCGGAVMSIRQITGKPIKFFGFGMATTELAIGNPSILIEKFISAFSARLRTSDFYNRWREQEDPTYSKSSCAIGLRSGSERTAGA